MVARAHDHHQFWSMLGQHLYTDVSKVGALKLVHGIRRFPYSQDIASN